MKCFQPVFAAALLVAAIVMTAPVNGIAATPDAPTFRVTASATKAAEGKAFTMYGRQLVMDGNDAYLAFDGRVTEASVVRSTNGGLTWGTPAVLSRNAISGSTKVVVAPDLRTPGAKIVVAMWAENGVPYRLMYSYFNEGGWSTPVAVPDSDNIAYQTANIVAAPNGSLHIIFTRGYDTYYVTTTENSAESALTYPVKLPWACVLNAMAVDQNSTVYAVEAGQNGTFNSGGLKLHKKAADSSTWTTSDLSTTYSTYVSIAVYDPNTIFISYDQPDTYYTTVIYLASSTNGGSSWTKSVIDPVSTYNFASIAVNSDKVLAAAVLREDGIYVMKSSNSGATWGQKTVVPNSRYAVAHLAVTSAGKFALVTYDESSSYDNFLRGSLSYIGNGSEPSPLYFTRER